MVLTPKAVVQLWQENLAYAREHKLGIFGAHNSQEFIDKINRERDVVFGKVDTSPNHQ